MPIQTTYGFTHDALQRGMVKNFQTCDAITAFSDAAIAFGLGVVYDSAFGTYETSRPKVALPAATGFTFLGVSKYTHKQNTGGDDGLGVLVSTEDAQYAIGDDITVVTRGSIVVYSESAVEPGDPVYLRHTANGAGTAPGQFRIDADTANADLLTGVQWGGKITAAGLVVLELNLP